jgi:regulator of protease activity HflC (stomatin/prohibitin superfamily)
MEGLGVVIVLVAVAALFVFSFRVLREYERGVVFQLGRFWRVKGPGLVLVIPGVQQMVRVGLRTVTMDVPSQDVISRDNVSVKVNAVVYFRVVERQRRYPRWRTPSYQPACPDHSARSARKASTR